MRTVENRIQYKEHFFKLSQGRIIELNDLEYWKYFWVVPEHINDIFELLTPYDIRTTRDQNPINYFLLISILSNQIIEFINNYRILPKFELLNCVRLLTKLLPYLFELPDYEAIEIQLFCQDYDPKLFNTDYSCINYSTISNVPEDKDVLCLKLITSLVDGLFLKGFTVPSSKSFSKAPTPTSSLSSSHSLASSPSSQSLSDTNDNISISLWEPGMGISSKYVPPNLRLESNRLEIMRLISTLCSNPFYQLPSQVVSKGSIFLTLLVSSVSRIQLLTLACSLMNVLCRSSRSHPNENMLNFQSQQLTFTRHLYITICTQLLMKMIIYPLPTGKNTEFLKKSNICIKKPYNIVRVYVGKLHKDGELMFLASCLISILKNPIETTRNANGPKFGFTGPTNPSLWTTEVIMFLWELFQCNKSFKQLAGKRYYTELTVILVCYIQYYHQNAYYKDMIRLTAYFLLYLSSDEVLIDNLLTPISNEFYNSLPYSMKDTLLQQLKPLTQLKATTRDLLIIQLCGILNKITANTQYNTPVESLLLTTLMEILYSIIPIISSEALPASEDPQLKVNNRNFKGGLSYNACTSLNNLVVRFSSKPFLLSSSINLDLLALLVRAICIASLRDPKASRMLLLSLLKGEKIYDKTWNTIYGLKTEYFSGDTLMLESIQDEKEEPKEEPPLTPQTPSRNSINELSINDSKQNTPAIEAENELKSPQSMFYIENKDENSCPNFHEDSNLDLNTDELELEDEVINAALRPKPPSGMTPRAKGKLRRDAPLNKTWAGNDALRIILTIIIPKLKLTLTEIWSGVDGTSIDTYTLAKKIETIDINKLVQENKKQINYDFLTDTHFSPLKFSWSHVSLGWYMSVLYGCIYSCIDNVQNFTRGNNRLMRNISTSLSTLSKFTSSWTNFTKGPSDAILDAYDNDDKLINDINDCLTYVNHWSKTTIKLFRIESEQSGFFDTLNSKLTSMHNQSAPGTPDVHPQLVRRISDIKIGTNKSSNPNSGLNTPKEEVDSYFPKHTTRNSVTSLHSLNTLNRSRTNTPRNSMSM